MLSSVDKLLSLVRQLVSDCVPEKSQGLLNEKFINGGLAFLKDCLPTATGLPLLWATA